MISFLEAAAMVKSAYEEGFKDGIYNTNSLELDKEWEESTAKIVYDGYMEQYSKR